MAFGAIGALPALGFLGGSMGFSPGLTMGLGLISGLSSNLLGPNKFPGFDEQEHPGYGVGTYDVNYSANVAGYMGAYGGNAASVSYPQTYGGYNYAQNGFQYGAVQPPQASATPYLYGSASGLAQMGAYTSAYQGAGYSYPQQYQAYGGGQFGGYGYPSQQPGAYYGGQQQYGHGQMLQGHSTGHVHLCRCPHNILSGGHREHPHPPKERPELKSYTPLPQVIDSAEDLQEASDAVKSRLTGDEAAQKVIHYDGKNPNNNDGFAETRLAVWKVLQDNPHLRYNVDNGNFFVTNEDGATENVMHVADAAQTIRAAYGHPQMARHMLRHQVDWAIDTHGTDFESAGSGARPNAADYVAPTAPIYQTNPYGFG